MSECVVRMEMPKNCEKCPMCGTESGGNGVYKPWCMCGDIPASSWRRPKDCPIICQLPEGHGRLVDMRDIDSMMEDIQTTSDESGLYGLYYRDDFDFDGLPTIVPAERSETEQV